MDAEFWIESAQFIETFARLALDEANSFSNTRPRDNERDDLKKDVKKAFEEILGITPITTKGVGFDYVYDKVISVIDGKGAGRWRA